MQLSQLLGIPQIHTGHSLGRSKQQRLLAQGRKPQALERQFSFYRRIATEEATSRNAILIITSTPQESDEQYGLYTNYHRERAVVIPPGTRYLALFSAQSPDSIGAGGREAHRPFSGAPAQAFGSYYLPPRNAKESRCFDRRIRQFTSIA